MVDTCLRMLEQGYEELKIAFQGLNDEDVWRRPAPALLSIGELAAHHVFWEAMRLAGEGPDPAKCRLQSPLLDARFRYYPVSLAATPGPEHLEMTAAQVLAEVLRLHAGAVAEFHRRRPDPTARIPGCPSGFTYAEYLEYAVFHLGYHTGQIYSVRHLLGDAPPDN